MRGMTPVVRVVGPARLLRSTGQAAVALGLIGWAVARAEADPEAAVPPQVVPSPTSTVQILDADRSGLRQPSTEIRIGVSDDPAPEAKVTPRSSSNPTRTETGTATEVTSYNTLRAAGTDLSAKRGATGHPPAARLEVGVREAGIRPSLPVSSTIRLTLGDPAPQSKASPGNSTELDFKLPPQRAAGTATAAMGVGPDDTFRVSGGRPSRCPHRRQTAERSPRVRVLPAADSNRSPDAVRVASHEEKPAQSGVEPKRQTFLAAPLLPAAGSGHSSPKGTTSVAERSERAALFQSGPFVSEPPVAEPLPQPPLVESPPAEPPLAGPPVSAPPFTAPPAMGPMRPVPDAATVRQLGPFEVMDHEDELSVVLRRSKLLRTKVDVYRTAVVDSSVCDVVQFTPREISIIGKGQGATHVTFWFKDEQRQPVTYLVRVVPDPEVQERREVQYEILEEILAELFPDSKVRLTPVADKLIVRGQARDAEEAAQILAIIRGEAVLGRGVMEGPASDPLVREETNRQLPATQVVNMLRIPGVHQVALRVKIAELDRSAARKFGVDVDAAFAVGSGYLIVQSLLNQAAGGASSILGKFDNDEINFGIHYLEKHGVVRMLSEPTLVTLSGRPASFVAGGEFAVPTTVGVGGVGAVTTDFRAYGAIITFVPTVIDKDHIRLEVAPEFSQIDSGLTSSNGTPGLSTRAVTTTVEMREGQTLAIAGLLDDSMKSSTQGDLPLVAKIFGMREVTRNETELIILVTPELVHPMEPEEVPPLPGFDVTEPTNAGFYLKGRIEGRPTHEYRSTVWPRLQRRYKAGGPAMISGPFGHGG